MAAPCVPMIGFVVDEWVRDAVVLMQAAKDPEWKWWLSFAASILGPLLSTAGSIYVAWKVFTWQGAKDRESWTRDQQKAEWSAILAQLTAVDLKLPHVFSNLDWGNMPDTLLLELRNVLPAMRNAMFISKELEYEQILKNFREFVSESAGKISEIKDLNQFLSEPPAEHTVEYIQSLNKLKVTWMEKRVAIYTELFNGFHKQANHVRQMAQKTLLLTDVSSDEQAVASAEALNENAND